MTKRPTAAEVRHIIRVREIGCLVCGSPASAHHVVGYADRMGRLSKNDRLVTGLCPAHHQHGPDAVHNTNHRKFYERFGIDLLAEAQRLEAESVALGILPELREAS